MRALRLARLDAQLQLRQGFYAAYALVSAAYIALLRALPDEATATLAPLVIFSDPAVFGFFCAGALLLLERDEGVHAALFTTPASSRTGCARGGRTARRSFSPRTTWRSRQSCATASRSS